MNRELILTAVALTSALFLFGQVPNRILPAIAAVAGALQILLVVGIVHLGVRGLSVHLVLGLAMLVPAVISYLNVNTKYAVTACTLLAFIGALQVAASIHGL